MATLSLPRNRAAFAVAFALVGLSGVAVNQLAFAAFTELGSVFYLFAAIAARAGRSLRMFFFPSPCHHGYSHPGPLSNRIPLGKRPVCA